MYLKHCRLLVTPTRYGKYDHHLKSVVEALVGDVIYYPTGKLLLSQEVTTPLAALDGSITGVDEIDTGRVFSAAIM